MVYILVWVFFLLRFFMAIFLIVSRHSPENCPLNNEKMKTITLELPEKLGALEKKHGVKRIGAWTVIPEHLTVVALLAVGYPREKLDIGRSVLNLVRGRKKLEEIVSAEEYGKAAMFSS